MAPPNETLTRPQRLIAGVFLLLVVDVIWVLSSEFTGYIFHDLHYDKPFFSTYFKTSLFMVYLTGFLFHGTWRNQCFRELNALPASATTNANGRSARRGMRYQRVNDLSECDESRDESADDETEPVLSRFLGSPTYVPANIPSESGKSSGTESENEVVVTGSQSRRVRFKDMAQVVEMSPGDALYANLARLSYSASIRARAALERAASKLTIREVIHVAMMFCLPWFMGNYCYQAALSNTDASIVNVLSSSSCLFTLLLSAAFPSEASDRLTLSKLCAVCFSMVGVIFVSYSDLRLEGGIPIGAMWTLLGSLFYSLYIVLLRRKVNHEDNMDSPMFFGFVGLFNAALLWPGLLALHLVKWEALEAPSATQMQFLVINGLVGTVFSELMWLWGCFYTSSLVATLAISLTIPLSVMADAFWKKKSYSPIFFVGAIPMFISFFIVGMLTHYQDWDPVWDGCHACWKRIRGVWNPSSRNTYVFDRNERESLINPEVATSPDDGV
ncbi:hypothetical protein TCAL_09140 [Tigriopus californicus]|uniref:Solute carrier family 35 member F5 n=1 Tax=Tigriopus californicus TaxID=6832 RepID=A0A553N8K9_TIGCA|nr:solute carrier family 35 member F5-like [Tigriopus californicus]TRY61755.1 hypothetical protein TCAL_09140 [Tigriopus californicus]|eukprot:TCALIF_09140-PA protein Name:"Similar to SLC35F5 Solute carrier family 35 member F5 (Pongo abelii)" AED:0.00 eAED:0.00 QI:0/-1/0/1/-1/1/1/0/499